MFLKNNSRKIWSATYTKIEMLRIDLLGIGKYPVRLECINCLHGTGGKLNKFVILLAD